MRAELPHRLFEPLVDLVQLLLQRRDVHALGTAFAGEDVRRLGNHFVHSLRRGTPAFRPEGRKLLCTVLLAPDEGGESAGIRHAWTFGKFRLQCAEPCSTTQHWLRHRRTSYWCWNHVTERAGPGRDLWAENGDLRIGHPALCAHPPFRPIRFQRCRLCHRLTSRRIHQVRVRVHAVRPYHTWSASSAPARTSGTPPPHSTPTPTPLPCHRAVLRARRSAVARWGVSSLGTPGVRR